MKKCKALLFPLVFILLTACDPGIYPGDEVGIWTEAVYSILGVEGRGTDGVRLIETDDYGRKMFYFLDSIGFNGITTYLLISQAEDDAFVYFYENYNISSIVGHYHNEQQEEDLKISNDWDKEVNLEKCVKLPKARDKKKSRIRKDFVSTAFKELSDIEEDYNQELYNIDSNGKHLFCMSKYGSPYKNEFMYIIILKSNGSYEGNDSIAKIDDIYNYNDILANFKEINDWKM